MYNEYNADDTLTGFSNEYVVGTGTLRSHALSFPGTKLPIVTLVLINCRLLQLSLY